MNKNEKIAPIKGFRDFTGEEAKKREFIRKLIVETFEKYGFDPAETPIIEDKSFVKGDNQGDDAISEIYSLSDKGKRDLALRYEFTFQLKRLMKDKSLPYRRYSIGTVFRDEPVSSARLRQITQCDIDVVGSTLRDGAETLKIAEEVLTKLDINFEIRINSRKLLNEILLEQGVQKKYLEQVIREIDKRDKLPKKELSTRLEKYGAENILELFDNSEEFFKKYSSFEEIKMFQKYAEEYGVKTTFSPYLARGLSYYNGIVFEILTKEIKEAICGGGSYMFNEVQCTGLALGLDRLSMLTNLKPERKTIMIIPFDNEREAIITANFLRNNNKPCFIYDGKISKAMKYADSQHIPYVLFLGDNEIREGKYKLKEMDSGKEKTLELEELISFTATK
jgi:histidyl-tRNA synthetase